MESEVSREYYPSLSGNSLYKGGERLISGNALCVALPKQLYGALPLMRDAEARAPGVDEG